MDLDLFNRASAFFTEEEALAKIKENQSAKRTRKDNNLHGDWLPVVVAGVRGQVIDAYDKWALERLMTR